MEDYSVVKPYTGPIPEFSRSPTPDDSPNVTATAGRKRKQAAVTGHNRSSSNQAPMYEQTSSPIAGPSHKRQKTQALRDTPTRQRGSYHGESLASGSASVSRGIKNEMPVDNLAQEPFDINANAGDPLAGEDYGTDVFEADRESMNLSLDPSSPGMMGPGPSPAEGLSIPDLRNLLPDFPLQSVERNPSVAAGLSTNATNSAFPTPQQQQYPQFSMPNPQTRFPPGCTQEGAVARDDPHGVWYYDPHDTCQIRLGHRHDMDGGVWFTNELGVTQSLLAMRRTEGIGFMLGVATAAEHILNLEGTRYLAHNGGSIDPRALMRQAARIVHDNVPAEVLDRENFRVPEVADVSRLSQTNSRLPPGHFYDPFHRRVVPYDMSGRSDTQVGRQGGGAAGRGAPSRQGTGPPGAETS